MTTLRANFSSVPVLFSQTSCVCRLPAGCPEKVDDDGFLTVMGKKELDILKEDQCIDS
jgi:hypothetical protein